MRVAHYRPTALAVSGQSSYFQELEPYSPKAHPGWMYLFRHSDANSNAHDPKVARRSRSTVTRPQGVLDLMETSWCGSNDTQHMRVMVHYTVDCG